MHFFVYKRPLLLAIYQRPPWCLNNNLRLLLETNVIVKATAFQFFIQSVLAIILSYIYLWLLFQPVCLACRLNDGGKRSLCYANKLEENLKNVSSTRVDNFRISGRYRLDCHATQSDVRRSFLISCISVSMERQTKIFTTVILFSNRLHNWHLM